MSDNKILFTEKRKESNGEEYLFEYSDTDDFSVLPQDRIKQVYGVCFVGNQIVIGYGGMKKGWGLIGGSIEKGETIEQTLKREICEESNLEVLSFLPIGYQKLTNQKNGKVIFQLRCVCKVESLGKFVVDGGDGVTSKGITEIKLINPIDYRKYFDWGEIGEHIIKRAIELRNQLI